MHQRRQRVLIGRFQRLVAAEHPQQRDLQRQAGVKAGAAGIRQRRQLGLFCRIEQRGRFIGEESELRNRDQMACVFISLALHLAAKQAHPIHPGIRRLVRGRHLDEAN